MSHGATNMRVTPFGLPKRCGGEMSKSGVRFFSDAYAAFLSGRSRRASSGSYREGTAERSWKKQVRIVSTTIRPTGSGISTKSESEKRTECVLLAFLKVEASKLPTVGLNLDRSPHS